MFIFFRYNFNKDLIKSRGYFSLLITISFLVSLVVKYIISKKYSFESLFFFLFCFLIYVLVSSSSKLNVSDLIEVIIYLLSIPIFVFAIRNNNVHAAPTDEMVVATTEKSSDNKTLVFFIIDVIIFILAIIVLKVSKKDMFKNFFYPDGYGYVCPKKNFENIITTDNNLICPID